MSVEVLRDRLPPDLDTLLAEVEKTCLKKALDLSGGVKHKAAKLLGITMDSFRYRYDKHFPGAGE